MNRQQIKLLAITAMTIDHQRIELLLGHLKQLGALLRGSEVGKVGDHPLEARDFGIHAELVPGRERRIDLVALGRALFERSVALAGIQLRLRADPLVTLALVERGGGDLIA